MNKLLAKDVIKLYPSYADTWKSRGCSDYWNLTNDTLSFFVRIDKNKEPQYPVDEAYYAEKPIEGIDLVMSCFSFFKKLNNRYKKLFDDPVFFIDSINVTRIDLQKYQPTDIATVTVYKDTNAIKLVGEQGRDGAIYIETKLFSRNKYWKFFKSRSEKYLKVVPTPESDTLACYILNGKILTANFEGDLSAIGDSDFVELKVIDKEQLIKDFGITDKQYGILIKTIVQKKSTPKNAGKAVIDDRIRKVKMHADIEVGVKGSRIGINLRGQIDQCDNRLGKSLLPTGITLPMAHWFIQMAQL